MSFIIRIILLFLALCVNIYANTNYVSDVILNVNGHSHKLPDLIGKEFNTAYLENRTVLENGFTEKHLDNHVIIHSVDLNEDITSIHFRSDPENEDHTKIDICIKDCKANASKLIVYLDWLGWRVSDRVPAKVKFDLWIRAQAIEVTNNTGMNLKIISAVYDVTNIRYESDGFLSPDFLITWLLQRFGLLDQMTNKPLPEIIGIEFPLLAMSYFDESKQSVVSGLNLSEEIADVLKSVPMEIEFKYNSITPQGFGSKLYERLIIELKFLHGKNTGSSIDPIYDSDTYIPSESRNLAYIGINSNGDKFNYVRQDDSTLTWEARVDTFFNRLANMGVNLVRLEAFWNQMCPELTSSDDINPSLRASTITDTQIDDYIDQMDFSRIKYLLSKAHSISITPYVIVGVGHENRPLKYVDPVDSITKIIAPGTVRGDNPNENGYYIGVADSVYLYWLSLYTSAVVRELKTYTDSLGQTITLWQLENELNAARFAESFDWWRKGSSWYDESTGGFQDRVLQTLYHAVVNEYQYRNEVKLVQDFHLFNAEKRIREWSESQSGTDYYDIVGLNFYPNQLNAYPLLGFMTGEFVWAARRILEYLDEEKPVWLVETGYGADQPAGEPEPQEFDENTKFYSQERQSDYLEDAFRTCDIYGAESIGWFLMSFREEAGSENPLEEINNYIGLYDKYGQPKLASSRFTSVSEDILNGDVVTFSNKYNDITIGGNQQLLNTMSTLKSPSILKLGSVIDYNVKCDQFVDYFDGIDTLNMQHKNWNSEITEFKLPHQFRSSENNYTQKAFFEKINSCTFDVNIPCSNEIELIKMIEIRDPWLVDATGHQSDRFFPLGATTDSTKYPFFLNMTVQTGRPFYSIRTPYVIYTTDSIHIFNDWNSSGVELFIDTAEPGEPNQKSAYFIQSNSFIQALYHTNLKTNIGQVYYYGNGIVKIKAPEYVADSVAIYRFVQWTTSTPGIVQFGNTQEFHTQLTVIGSDARIEAEYENAFENEEDIVLNQNFVIPEGANYKIPPDMDIIQYTGRFEILGTREKPVILDVGDEIPLAKVASANEWNGIVLNGVGGGAQISNTIFRNASRGLLIKNVPQSAKPTKIHNCVFTNLDTAVIWYDSDQTPSYTNYLDMRNCIFYNNTGPDVHLNLDYRLCSEDTLAYNRFYPYKSNNILKTIYSVSYKLWEYDNIRGTDPHFLEPDSANYRLTGLSTSCIDKGDAIFPDDPDGTRIDIGAYYYPQLQGTLTENLTIDGDARIIENLTVPQGIELTILPGSRIFLDANVRITVDGLFTAVGTSEDKIQFTSVYSNPTTAQYWDYIRFNDAADDAGILKHCIIEYADHGVNIYKADITLENNEIHHIYPYYGMWIYYSNVIVKDNYLHDMSSHGIYMINENYAGGTSIVSGNTIEDAIRGIYLSKSSPDMKENVISDCDIGVFCYYYSSPNLGWMDVRGMNWIYNNDKNMYCYRSNPFLGQEFSCSDNGGYNILENAADWQIEARTYSTVVAENNWWNNEYDFYADGTSSIDYWPALPSRPLFKMRTNSGENIVFDTAFPYFEGDSSLTDKEVMENYRNDWPIGRKLRYARNLMFLNFPHLTEQICSSIIKSFPDSAQSRAALNLLWVSGRFTSAKFEKFRTYLDTLLTVTNRWDISDDVKMISDGFDEEKFLAKSVSDVKNRYKTQDAQSMALLDRFIYYLLLKNDYAKASSAFIDLKTNYPKSQATIEALNHLQLFQSDNELPQELRIPTEFTLIGNFPNPFNPETTIRFELPQIADIELKIYNLLGQQVRRIQTVNSLPGVNEVIWDGKNTAGQQMPSGMYVYSITANARDESNQTYHASGKMVLLK